MISRWGDAYYVLCFFIGVVALRAPQYASRLSFYESAANLGLLILSVGVWYVHMLSSGPRARVRSSDPYRVRSS